MEHQRFGAQTSHITTLDVTTIQLHTSYLWPVDPTNHTKCSNHCRINTKPIATKQELTDFPRLKGLQLAHPVTSTELFSINLLIRADHYCDVVEDHIIKENGPTTMGSKLIYLLSGPVEAATQRNTTANILHVAS